MDIHILVFIGIVGLNIIVLGLVVNVNEKVSHTLVNF